MSCAYTPEGEVDTVKGALGPLYYATVSVSGMPVEALIDPGSSAAIMSFDLFQKVGQRAGVPRSALKRPDVVLRDYSQRPILIGAQVELEFEWGGKAITVPVYLRSD